MKLRSNTSLRWDRESRVIRAKERHHFLKQRFAELGLERIQSESFDVSVPIDKGGQLRLPDGSVTPVYALWPNGVRTPSLPRGHKGPLVYGVKGALKEVDGKPLEGAIVLLDFDGGQNFLNLATLGTRAVVFFDNGGVNREQAADKFLKVSVDVPRFWVDSQDAQALRSTLEKGDMQVHLESQMDWESVRAQNVYGWLPGTDALMPPTSREDRQAWKEQVIVIQAYYDAMSVVPARAPGAENAVDRSAFTVDKLQAYRPNYTVLFLATSGHFQG